jgi:hypothetical protein
MESEKFEEIFNSGTKLTEATAKIRQRESLLRQTAQLAAFAENRPYVAPPPTGQVITAGTTHTALKAVEANIEALLRDRKICKKPLVPTMSDPLARAFIEQMAKFWKDRTSSPPAPGNQAAFIRFLAAAWEDLKFPEPVDRKGNPKPLQDWFAERVPKQRVKGKFTSHGI